MLREETPFHLDGGREVVEKLGGLRRLELLLIKGRHTHTKTGAGVYGSSFKCMKMMKGGSAGNQGKMQKRPALEILTPLSAAHLESPLHEPSLL